jgi:tryptophan synthase alpha chain
MSSAPQRKRLVVYLVCEPETPELALAAIAGGADIVELGIPFSDPLAEGPVIRRASERALSRGMRTRRCLDVIAELRAQTDVPIVPMTYAAILEAYGYDRFAHEAKEAGATSAIIVDLPVEEHPELKRIQLIAPTSTDERIRAAANASDGWLYIVTVTGTTGAREELSVRLAPLIERTRALAPAGLPLYPGFGISTPEHAREVAAIADGVVVGSRVVQIAEDGPNALRDYVASLREALDAVDARAAV